VVWWGGYGLRHPGVWDRVKKRKEYKSKQEGKNHRLDSKKREGWGKKKAEWGVDVLRWTSNLRKKETGASVKF